VLHIKGGVKRPQDDQVTLCSVLAWLAVPGSAREGRRHCPTARRSRGRCRCCIQACSVLICSSTSGECATSRMGANGGVRVALWLQMCCKWAQKGAPSQFWGPMAHVCSYDFLQTPLIGVRSGFTHSPHSQESAIQRGTSRGCMRGHHLPSQSGPPRRRWGGHAPPLPMSLVCVCGCVTSKVFSHPGSVSSSWRPYSAGEQQLLPQAAPHHLPPNQRQRRRRRRQPWLLPPTQWLPQLPCLLPWLPP
jgi:hypothetical protein